MSAADKIEKTEEESTGQFLYVLEARVGTFRNSTNFLKNRGWKIHSSTKVKEFLAIVLQHQPPFVMVCIDHPNPAAANLSRLIQNAFPATKVIAFVDGTSSASLTKIKNSGNEYTVYPPLSGPAIERVILRVQKDQQKAAEAPTSESGVKISTDSDSNTDSSVVIKGSGTKTTAVTEQARRMLAQFMSSDDPHDGTAAVAHGGGSGMNTGGAIRTGVATTAGAADQAQASQPTHRGSAIMGGQRRLRRPRRPLPMDFSPGGGWQLREPTPGSDPYADGDSPAISGGTAGTSASGTNNGSYQSSRNQRPEAPVFEHDGTNRRKKGLPSFEQAEASLIIKATDDALDKTVIKGRATTPTEVLQKTTSVACIAVESTRFTGYLVAALGKNRKIDDKFIATVRGRLVEYMRANGEELAADDSMALNLQEVEFESWALQQADFLRKTIHDGQEIAMAFFPHKIDNAPLEISASASMLKVDIEELLGNATVEFDLYIHMPTNNKYILYTKQDRQIYGDQLDRLKSKGVKSMHLRKEDETNVRRYRVRNFLNDKIKELQDDSKAS